MPDTTMSPFLRFDFADETGTIHRRTFTQPETILVAHCAGDVPGVLKAVQSAAENGRYAAGFLAYEAATAFDPAFRVRSGGVLPLAWFGVFRHPIPVSDLPEEPANGPFHVSDWTPEVSHEQYLRTVTQLRAAIGAGEVYQVNHTLRLQARFEGNSGAFYLHLARAQQSGFGAYLDLGRYRILSASPELFFRRKGDTVTVRPMKGTAARGRWRDEDDILATTLAASEKNRAENIMIVDLLRNDIGRLAQVGSVRVESLFDVERYPTLLQLTSTISAQVPSATSLLDLFSALFPCGSVTGAPKIRAMHWIAALENAPREAYCGAIGYVEPGGNSVFNVGIRTLTLDTVTGLATYGTGGGITWDSHAEDEYAEAMAKAAVLTVAYPRFDLLETLRLEAGQYFLLDRHLARLADSAAYFGIRVSRAHLERLLLHQAQALGKGTWRIRLLVSPEGTARTESFPLDLSLPGPCPFSLAKTPISRHDRFLFHKTTHRAIYETHRKLRPDVYDVLLWNAEGEVTEFTTGNLVVEVAGKRITPPRDGGLLAGTLRAELLEQGEIEERVVKRTDILIATRLWLINSVRGWIPVFLVE